MEAEETPSVPAGETETPTPAPSNPQPPSDTHQTPASTAIPPATPTHPSAPHPPHTPSVTQTVGLAPTVPAPSIPPPPPAFAHPPPHTSGPPGVGVGVPGSVLGGKQLPPRPSDLFAAKGAAAKHGLQRPGTHARPRTPNMDINIMSDGPDPVPSSQPPLVDKTFMLDPWRPEDYKSCLLVAHKGRSLDDSLPDRSNLPWTARQHFVFERVLALLDSNRLARLVFHDTVREHLLARVQIEKTSEQLRRVFASVQWEGRLLQWLNVTLLDLLPRELLVVWVDLFRYMYTRTPALFEARGLLNLNSSERFRHNLELPSVLTSPLFPDFPNPEDVEFKFPRGDPVFVLVPGDTPWSSIGLTGRLGQLGRVVCVDGDLGRRTVHGHERYQLAAHAATQALRKIREETPKAPVVLVGHVIGARIACQLGAQHRVHAVVCLGYPLRTLSEKDDTLLKLKGTPSLFLVGTNSTWCPLGDMERVRRQVRSASSVLQVIPGADDALMSEWKYQRMGTTQHACDQKIFREVGGFLQQVLAKRRQPAAPRPPGSAPARKRKPSEVGEDGQPKKPRAKRARTASVSTAADPNGGETVAEGGDGERGTTPTPTPDGSQPGTPATAAPTKARRRPNKTPRKDKEEAPTVVEAAPDSEQTVMESIGNAPYEPMDLDADDQTDRPSLPPLFFPSDQQPASVPPTITTTTTAGVGGLMEKYMASQAGDEQKARHRKPGGFQRVDGFFTEGKKEDGDAELPTLPVLPLQDAGKRGDDGEADEIDVEGDSASEAPPAPEAGSEAQSNASSHVASPRRTATPGNDEDGPIVVDD